MGKRFRSADTRSNTTSCISMGYKDPKLTNLVGKDNFKSYQITIFMKLYFATGSIGYLEFLLTMGVKNILISYAYQEPWRCENVIKQHNIKIMCDSGAFTSWSQAQKKKAEGDPVWEKYLVNLDDYMKFIDRYRDIIDRAVNLDVIPGQQGMTITDEQRTKSAEEGWKNYLIMKEKGYNPIHVFHQGEDYIWLDKMINEGCDYIGVSPSNDKTDNQKIEWLDHAFRLIANSKNPTIKTHAFGVTSYKILSRYPWYSADSSTYSLTAAMGSILTPYGRVYVSEANLDDPDHINNKPQQIKDHIDKYLMERIGYSLNSTMVTKHYKRDICPKCKEEIEVSVFSQAYKTRNYANIAYLLDIEKRVNEEGPNLAYLKQQTMFNNFSNDEEQKFREVLKIYNGREIK